MKSLFQFAIFLFVSGITFAQTPKQNRIDRSSFSFSLLKAVELNGKIYSIGINDANYSTNNIIKQDFNLNVEQMFSASRGVWGLGDKEEILTGICSTPDNNLILAGTIGLKDQTDLYAFKMDTLGNVIWQRSIEVAVNQAWLGLISNNVGGALLYASEFPNPGQNKVELINLDTNGDTLWTRKISDPLGGDINNPLVYQKSNGNFVVLSFTRLIEIDVNGNLIGVSSYQDVNGSIFYMLDVDYSNSAALITAKYYDATADALVPVLMKIDDSNDVVWVKNYPGIQEQSRPHVLDDDNILVVGRDVATPTSFLNLIPVIKVNSIGNPIKGVAFGKRPYVNSNSNIISFSNHYLFSGSQNLQAFNTGYQILTDSNLISNSCYQREFEVTSVDVFANKVAGNPVDLVSLGPDISFFGPHPNTLYVSGGSTYIQYDINGNLTTQFDVLGDDCGGSCIGEVLLIPNGGSPSYNYLWSNGQTSSLASGLCSFDTISVRTGDQDGCYVYDTAIVLQQTPVNELCLITVDETSTKNEVVWEKPISNSIEGFVIHREVAGNYNVVGYVPYDSLSKFVDNTVGVNPNITSYRYKLTTIDTCGNESDYSDFHETIHLTVNQGAGSVTNLIWDNYEGFSFSYNRIWKDSLGDGNWVLRDSVSSNVFTWTDIYASTTVTEYRIEVVSPSVCTSTKAQDHNSTRSNRSTIAGPPVEVSVDELEKDFDFTVFPNPFSTFITLKLNQQNAVVFSLLDVQGRILKSYNLNGDTNIIDLPDLNTGVYIVQIESEGKIKTKKLIRK